jgi:hypothetical protein
VVHPGALPGVLGRLEHAVPGVSSDVS